MKLLFSKQNIQRTIFCLCIIAIIVIIISTISGLYQFNSKSILLNNFFYVNNNFSLPKWFNSSLLLIIGIISYFIYLQNRNNKKNFHWLLFSITYILLSVSKIASLHRFVLNQIGMVHKDFPFPIYYIALIILFFVITFFFWLAQYNSFDKRINRLIINSFIIYIGFGLLFAITSYILFYYSKPLYIILSGLEEFCELMGIIILLKAFLLQTKC